MLVHPTEVTRPHAAVSVNTSALAPLRASTPPSPPVTPTHLADLAGSHRRSVLVEMVRAHAGLGAADAHLRVLVRVVERGAAPDARLGARYPTASGAPMRAHASRTRAGVAGPPPITTARTDDRSVVSKAGSRSISAIWVGTPPSGGDLQLRHHAQTSAARHGFCERCSVPPSSGCRPAWWSGPGAPGPTPPSRGRRRPRSRRRHTG